MNNLFNEPAEESYDLYVNFDGGCEQNPGGRATWAFVIKDKSGDVVLEANGEIPPGRTSNNVAEYVAAKKALQAIHEIASDGWKVVLRGDSQIVIGKLNRPGHVSKGLCFDACIDAQEAYAFVVGEGISVELQWVPRTQNTEADALT